MRHFMIAAMVVAALTLHGCSEDSAPESAHENRVLFNGTAYDFDTVTCRVDGSDGGPTTYRLYVGFSDTQSRRVEFSVQDATNDPAKLLEVGEHPATGQHSDAISNHITSSSFSWGYLNDDQLSIVWESIEVGQHDFNGRGYVEIKQQINAVCADSIWVGGRFAGPGDPEYDNYFESYCAPGYFYPAQKVRFTCTNGQH